MLQTLKKPFLWAAALVLVSWSLTHVGISIGRDYFKAGDGYPRSGFLSTDVQRDLFRFDSYYYLSIAESGYRYDGNPGSSPNLVFGPMFPILVNGFGFATGLDSVSAGLALNKLLLFLSAAILITVLGNWLGFTEAFWVLFAMLTSAGSYSFHAFYSESAMLLFLSLALLGVQRQKPWLVAASAAALGLSRVAAAPMVIAFALYLLQTAWTERRNNKPNRARAFLLAIYPLVSLSGLGAYLFYIDQNFGNPFELLPEIQKNSWGQFHADANWIDLLTGRYLYEDAKLAFAKGLGTFLEIQTLNLFWMCLALMSSVYLLVAWRHRFLALLFVPYVLFIYFTNATSPFLISSHRFFVFDLPIFIMVLHAHKAIQTRTSKAAAWLFFAGPLLMLNASLGILHAALFNQGVWFWF